MEEIKIKAAEIEIYADIMDMLSARKKWYQHVDETTGEYVADDSDDARQHLAAFQKVEQKILKLAGV